MDECCQRAVIDLTAFHGLPPSSEVTSCSSGDTQPHAPTQQYLSIVERQASLVRSWQQLEGVRLRLLLNHDCQSTTVLGPVPRLPSFAAYPTSSASPSTEGQPIQHSPFQSAPHNSRSGSEGCVKRGFGDVSVAQGPALVTGGVSPAVLLDERAAGGLENFEEGDELGTRQSRALLKKRGRVEKCASQLGYEHTPRHATMLLHRFDPQVQGTCPKSDHHEGAMQLVGNRSYVSGTARDGQHLQSGISLGQVGLLGGRGVESPAFLTLLSQVRMQIRGLSSGARKSIAQALKQAAIDARG